MANDEIAKVAPTEDISTELVRELPVGFATNERGNVFLTLDDMYLAWYRCGLGVWLEVSICPCNYPATSVSTFRATDEELITHLQEHCVGWDVMKINLDGAEAILTDEGTIADPDDD